MDLRLIVIHTGSVSVIFDDVNDQPRHRVQGLKGVVIVANGYRLDVAVNAGFGADAEKERRHVFDFENSLFRQLCDKRHKILFGGVRSLEDVNPLLEPYEKFLS